MQLSTLSQKITALTAGIALAFTLILGLSSFWYIKSHLVTQIYKDIDQEIYTFQVPIESFLTELNHNLENMSKNLLVVNALVDSQGREIYIGPFLNGYSPPLDILFQLVLLDFEGNPISGHQRLKINDLHYEQLVRTTISAERPYAALIKNQKSHSLLLAYPVFYGATGMAEGILVLKFSFLEAFSKIVDNHDHLSHKATHDFICLKQREAPLFAIGLKSAKEFYTVGKPLSLPPVLQALELNIEYGESRTEALAPIKKISWIYMISGLIMSLAITLASNWAAKKIARPIFSLSRIANQVAKTGNPDAEIDTNQQGEVGILAQSFKTMLSRLADAQNSLESQVEKRTQDLRLEIAERAKTEAALKLSRTAWENTFDAMSDIITIQDEKMRIVRANKAAYTALHLEPGQGQLNGKYCYEVFRESDIPCSGCPGLTTRQEGKTHSRNIEHPNLEKIFHVTSSPIFDADGGFTQLVHIAKDITQEKKLEDDLFQAHKMEAIGTLAGGIAHDFNNILSAILGYASLANYELKKNKLPASYRTPDHLNQIIKAGDRATELVKQILTFSRKGSEKQHAMRPALVIKEALTLMRASLPTTVTIQEELDPQCGSIMANPTNIHQVLVNLCTNALHAMENEKGVLTVRLKPTVIDKAALSNESKIAPGNFIELQVSDTGCGMDQATIKRAFEPYFTTKGMGKGSGMGLALVHGIIQGCDGFIKINSESGQGTTIHIYFPTIQEERVVVEKTVKATLPTGQEQILVVDDEQVIVDLYQTILENRGYQVTALCDSDETLTLFQAEPDRFDLVITDQTMPNLSGSELAKKLLQLRPNLPIILCTGYSAIISKEKAKEIGIKQFLMKPVSTTDLTHTVRMLLDQ